MGLLEHWRHAVRDELELATELRHHIHQNPRISGNEGDTAAAVAAAIGCGTGDLVAETGRIISVADGPATDAEPAIVLRAELDGLPVIERTDVSWASTNGAMHACGHDLHLAALTAVARAAARIDLPVPLRILLQPREESGRSGAADVVAEGAMHGVRAVVGAHVQPQLAAGVLGVTPGAVNAGTNEFTVEIRGRGGHTGYPHTVQDPVLALAAVVVALQQVSSRRIDPTVGAVCMVTQLSAGTAANVVPMSATARGTVRTMSRSDETLVRKAMDDIVNQSAAAYDCAGDISFDSSQPPLVNDSALAAGAARLLAAVGHEVTPDFRSFGADDFSHFCESTRGLMIFVGTGRGGDGLHDAHYLPSDDYLGVVADALIAGYCAAAG